MPNRFFQALILVLVSVTVAGADRLALAQTEPLNGTVVNKADNGLEGVRVVLRAPKGGEIIEEQISDEDGLFSLPMESLIPGHEIHLHKDGYDDVTIPVSPHQLVVAKIKVILHRTRTEKADEPSPAQSPTPRPTPVWLEDKSDRRDRAVRLYNEAITEFEEAEEDEEKTAALLKLRQSASIDPDFSEPLRALIGFAIKRQSWAEVSRYAEALIRIDPNDEEAIRYLYVSLVITRHFKRVGEAAKRLITYDPEQIGYVEQHAREFYQNNIFKMARALYQALAEITPDDPNAYLNLGLCCANMGDVEAAREAYEKFLELAPEDNPDIEAVRQELAGLDAPGVPESPQ